MPFLWTVVTRRGQLFGNDSAGSSARIANGKNFSYPGYNELFTGFPDPRIDRDDKFANPNVSVFEWLNRKDGFRGRVAAFGSWDVFPYILNRERHGRGDPPRCWRDHGEKVKGSKAIWIAVLGPDTPALGERANTAVVTQGQVAATIAALLGEDYLADAPKSARPLADVIRPAGRPAGAPAESRSAGSPSAPAPTRSGPSRSGTPSSPCTRTCSSSSATISTPTPRIWPS